MLLPLSSIVLATQLIVTVADEIPNLNFEPGCRAAATTGVGETSRSCIDDEKTARDKLAKEWSQFSVADRRNCTEEVSSFAPSYVELLTCLEVARDAKNEPKN
jgi:hypothetical protein